MTIELRQSVQSGVSPIRIVYKFYDSLKQEFVKEKRGSVKDLLLTEYRKAAVMVDHLNSLQAKHITDVATLVMMIQDEQDAIKAYSKQRIGENTRSSLIYQNVIKKILADEERHKKLLIFIKENIWGDVV